MRDLFVQKLLKLISNDPKVVLLTADLGFGAFECFEPFRDKQYFNVGISEQLMASMAAGLSLEGFKVFIYSIGVFPTLRCLEQIRNDISYHDCSVTIVTTGAGFSYGSLGMTHHCVQDIGVIRSIPNIDIFTPANMYEMDDIFDNSKGIRYFRLDKSEINLIPINKIHRIFCYCYFKNQKYQEKDKTLILSHGSICSISLPFFKDQFKIDVYTLAKIKESQDLLDLCKKYKKILTIEEHSEINGFFSFISSLLSKYKILKEIDYVALPEDHISIVGDQAFLREKLKLDSNSLYSKII